MSSDGGADDALDLVVATTVGDGVLKVGFSIENRSGETLYVYAHPDDGERASVLPGAFVCVAGSPPELRLLLGVPPVPHGYFVHRAVLPLARVLAPGDRYESKVALEIPVREWSPYLEPDDDQEPEEVTVDRGVLRIEYVPRPRALWANPGPEEGTVWTEGLDRRAVTARFELVPSIPTQVRRESFPRW